MTSEKMRHSIYLVLIISLALMFSGCVGEATPVSTDIITFRDIPWNATPDEIENTYLPGVQLTEETPYMQHYARQLYSAENIEVYGNNAAVVFEFRSYAEAANGLYTVYVLFPERANAESIREKLVADYGEPQQYEDDYIPNISDHALWWDGTTPIDQFLLAAYPQATTVPDALSGGAASRIHWVDNIENFFTIYHYVPDEWVSRYPHACAIIYEGFCTEMLQRENADK